MNKVSFLEDNIQKEYLSTRYIQTIANLSGFKTCSDDKDHGVDLTITLVKKTTLKDGKSKFRQSGIKIDLQLKSTTNKYFQLENGSHSNYEYLLRVQNYNDLIERKEDPIPLILIVFICPENIDDFIDVSCNELLIKGEAYWYKPDNTLKLSTKNSNYKEKISIPNSNKIDKDFFNTLFIEHFPHLNNGII